MAEMRHRISYFYAYHGEIKGKSVGYARIEEKGGEIHVLIRLEGILGFEKEGLEAFLYRKGQGKRELVPMGRIVPSEGRGELAAQTEKNDLFGKGMSAEEWGGICLRGRERETIYLTNWESKGMDREGLLSFQEGRFHQKQRREAGGEDRRKEEEQRRGPDRKENLPERKEKEEQKGSGEKQKEVLKTQEISLPLEEKEEERREALSPLWEELCRYYPKVAPELAMQGVELLRIRPADIRYLPRRLWHLGNNSFLLHGYYRYKHLVLGYISQSGQYLIGVRGNEGEREAFSASLFGFHQFMPVHREGIAGYWYQLISLEEGIPG